MENITRQDRIGLADALKTAHLDLEIYKTREPTEEELESTQNQLKIAYYFLTESRIVDSNSDVDDETRVYLADKADSLPTPGVDPIHDITSATHSSKATGAWYKRSGLVGNCQVFSSKGWVPCDLANTDLMGSSFNKLKKSL